MRYCSGRLAAAVRPAADVPPAIIAPLQPTRLPHRRTSYPRRSFIFSTVSVPALRAPLRSPPVFCFGRSLYREQSLPTLPARQRFSRAQVRFAKLFRKLGSLARYSATVPAIGLSG